VAAVRAPAGLADLAGRQSSGALADAGLLWIATPSGIALMADGHGGLVWRGRRAPDRGALAAIGPSAQAAHEGSVFPPTRRSRASSRRRTGGLYRGLDEAVPGPHCGRLGGAAAGRRQSTTGNPGSTTQSLWGGAVFNGDLDVRNFSASEPATGRTWRPAKPIPRRSSRRCPCASLSRFDQDPIAGFRPFGGDTFRIWDENPDAQPEIRLLESWREEAGPVEALGALPRLSPGQGVIETGRSAAGSARPGRARLLRRTPESFALATQCPDAAWLFVLRAWLSHRPVDGLPVAPAPAQLPSAPSSPPVFRVVAGKRAGPGFLPVGARRRDPGSRRRAGEEAAVSFTPIPTRAKLLAPAALFGALMLVLYADPLFLRRNFAGRDLNAYNLSMEKSVHDAWARGSLPVWQSEVSGGRPLLPNPNAGALYPVRMLVSRLAFPLAFRVYPIVHWIAATECWRRR
jgi:hypothetical protein